MDGSRARRRRLGYVVALGVACLGAAYAYLTKLESDRKESIALYDIVYPTFLDWKKSKYNPYVLFGFQHPAQPIRIQGSVNQVESEVNPTPDLHTDGIAQYYIDRTRENMPGWKAKQIGDVEAKGVRFRVIERESPVRRVVSGFAVKGNTTLIVSMTAGVEGMNGVPKLLPQFQDYLARIEFRPAPMVASRD